MLQGREQDCYGGNMTTDNGNELSALRSQRSRNLIERQDYISRMARLHAALHAYADHIGDTVVEEIRITPGKVVLKAKGIAMVFDPYSEQPFPACFLNDGDVEPHELESLNKVLSGIARPGMVLWDIGAHVGWYPIHWHRLFPSALISAFEPLPYNFDQMVENLALNNASAVKALRLGFSDKEGSFPFYLVKDRPANGSMVNTLSDPNAEVVQCPVTTIDKFVADGNAMPDFIKCDVEGAELAVLRGGLDTLRKKRPVVFAEVMRKWCAKYNYNPNEIFDLMSGLGYQCFAIGDAGPRPFRNMEDSTVESNFLFKP